MYIKHASLKYFKRLYLNEIETVEYTPNNKFQLIVGRNGSGKAQPLYSRILTPSGWVAMGSVKKGDEVITPNGGVERILAVFPQGYRPIFKLTTETGRITHCDRDHLWKIYIKDKWVLEETNILRAHLRNNTPIFVPVYDEKTFTTHREQVVSIKEVKQQLAQCIMISGDEHLYITDDYIVTHNTSLLNSIFNQPADKQDYELGGYNKLLVEHNNFEYLLINDFTASPKYYFKRRPIDSDEEYVELNQSRLISTQRELFLEHFRLDSDIIALLLNEVEFTSMSVSTRREWFNKMHVADLTYINKVYQTLKKKHRDTIGTINMVGNKLIIEKNTQISEEEYLELETRREQLSRETVELAKSFNQEIIDGYKSGVIKQTIDQLNLNNKKLKSYFQNNKVNYGDLAEDIDTTKTYLATIITRKSEMEKQLIQTKKRYDRIALDMKEYSKYSSTETLNQCKKEYEDKLKQINSSKTRYNEFSEFMFNSSYLNEDNIENALTSVLLAIPPQDDDMDLVKINQDTLVTQKHDLITTRDNIDFNLSRLQEKKKHLESHLNDNMIVCPNCKMTFNKEKDSDSLESIMSGIANLVNQSDDVSKELSKVEKTLENYLNFKDRFNELKPLIVNYDIGELIQALVKARTYSKRTDLIKGYFTLFGLRLQERKIETELNLVNEQLKIRAEKGEDYYERIDSNLNSVNDELLSYQETINKLNDEITLVKKNLETKKVLFEIGIKENNELLKNLNEAYLAKMNYEKNKLLKERWENTLRELQVINQKHTEYEMKNNLIKNYEAMIEENKSKRDSYAIALEELSPQGGLIAERATAFINIFISNLNIVIRKIFNYDLIVEPCDIAVGDLTYRFKVTGGNQVRNDVSNTSEGQKEVINLAFKMLAYYYCHLEDIPFINDELGKNFDEYHKQASVNYLRELMVEGKFNQFFLISHHATSYTSLLDAEVVVLDPNNVVLPEKYNTSIVINGEQ